ncbi:DUF2141 domain-containing protein [Sphingomonas sp. ID1715]|uniref:DUF2141 domain-containing protein n=1 Tax=Sphingomonas sp. ID1715 TaxID=1656898 RepID=UPI0020C1FB4C|nr:DUF2141 domain-containing protein [Sphingomonas sp. ID1715]
MALSATLLLGAAEPGAVELDVAGLRSAKGVVQVCLTRDPVNFPGCTDDKFAVKRKVPATQTRLSFGDLPTGAYAAALIHDENANNRLDTMLGIPREGFGFSRNPVIAFGPPKFAAARFTVAAGETIQRIQMKYLL